MISRELNLVQEAVLADIKVSKNPSLDAGTWLDRRTRSSYDFLCCLHCRSHENKMMHVRNLRKRSGSGAAVTETRAKTSIEEASSVFRLYHRLYYDHLWYVQ